MKPRLAACATFAALLTAAFFATETGAQPNSVKKIADGVWFREGDMSQGHSNNAIIEMQDYLIVIDANFPSGARLAMADAKKLSPKPVKYVFITHHHGDHDYGSRGLDRRRSHHLRLQSRRRRTEPLRAGPLARRRRGVAKTLPNSTATLPNTPNRPSTRRPTS